MNLNRNFFAFFNLLHPHPNSNPNLDPILPPILFHRVRIQIRIRIRIQIRIRFEIRFRIQIRFHPDPIALCATHALYALHLKSAIYFFCLPVSLPMQLPRRSCLDKQRPRGLWENWSKSWSTSAARGCGDQGGVPSDLEEVLKATLELSNYLSIDRFVYLSISI